MKTISERFTVDTQNDFETMKTIASELPPFPLSTPTELITKVASNPTIKKSMQIEIEKNKK